MTTWDEIRDEIAGMLADGKPLEDVIDKLEKRKNEMTKLNLLKEMDDMKKPHELTNEKWFCQLPTEEKAKRIINIAVNSNCDYRTIVDWLKQPHTTDNSKTRNIKEIALDLLNKYEEAKESVIWEYSGDIDGDVAQLKMLVNKYRDEIERSSE